MTPFAEDILEQAPMMSDFFEKATFHDMNASSSKLHDRCERFIKGEGQFSLKQLPEGAYWFECSGTDPRRRIGFCAQVNQQEMTAELLVQRDGQIMTTEGVVWLLMSKVSPLLRIIPVDEQCSLHMGYAILLASIVEALG